MNDTPPRGADSFPFLPWLRKIWFSLRNIRTFHAVSL